MNGVFLCRDLKKIMIDFCRVRDIIKDIYFEKGKFDIIFISDLVSAILHLQKKGCLFFSFQKSSSRTDEGI